jgi:hypothetical protein
MKGKDTLLRIYSGSELSVISLNNKLEVKGMTALIRYDSNNSFLQVAPKVVDLHIEALRSKQWRIHSRGFNNQILIKQSPYYLNSLIAVTNLFTE